MLAIIDLPVLHGSFLGGQLYDASRSARENGCGQAPLIGYSYTMANAANHGVPMADGMVYSTAAAAIHPPVQNPMATGQAFAVNNNPAEMQHRAMVMNSMQCMPVGPIAAGMHPFAAPWHASGSRSSVSDPLVSYSCKYPGCAKVYSSSDGARKHARNHHPEWLKQVETSKRAVDAYCIRSEGVPRPVATRPPTMA